MGQDGLRRDFRRINSLQSFAARSFSPTLLAGADEVIDRIGSSGLSRDQPTTGILRLQSVGRMCAPAEYARGAGCKGWLHRLRTIYGDRHA
jgi:hypothetical protein